MSDQLPPDQVFVGGMILGVLVSFLVTMVIAVCQKTNG